MKTYEKNIAGLKKYIASQRAEAERVIAEFRKNVADPDSYIIWALRPYERVIYASVLLNRLAGLESAIVRYNNAVAFKVDPAPLTEECGGELTEQSFCDSLVQGLTKQLAERARHLNSGLETQAERNADLEIMARIIDEGQYRWYAQEEVTAS